jgi:DNA replication protein DnaC
MAKMEGDDIVLRRYRECRACMDYEVAKSEGWDWPTHHPKMPFIFRATDENRLHPNMQKALSWVPTIEKSGMLLHGTTGIGKSRAAWEWVNRKWLKGIDKDVIYPFLFLTMSDLEELLQQSWSEKKHSEVLKEIIDIPVLALDDFGKERLTSRMAADLFAVIDKRSINAKATIITTNFNGNGLIDRFLPQDKETGIALVRRLRDYYATFGMN